MVKRKKSPPREGRRDGRPPVADPALDAAIADVLGGDAIVDAAARHHLSPGRVRTLRRRLASQPLASGAAPAPTPAGPSVAKVAAPSGAQAAALPQGGAHQADPVALMLRILDARDPAAAREARDGIHVFARGGEEALGPWLARPIEAPAIDAEQDLADIMREGLGLAVAHAKALGPGHAKAGAMLEKWSTLTDRLDKLLERRRKTRPPTPDEVQVQIGAIHDEAFALLETTVRAEEDALGLP